MIKYIVLWILASYQSVPCPSAGKPNAFGVVENASFNCLVNHTERREEHLKKEFETREEAEAFMDSLYCYKETQCEGFSMLGSSKITTVKLDSIK